jgi:hypothetical protein
MALLLQLIDRQHLHVAGTSSEGGGGGEGPRPPPHAMMAVHDPPRYYVGPVVPSSPFQLPPLTFAAQEQLMVPPQWTSWTST